MSSTIPSCSPCSVNVLFPCKLSRSAKKGIHFDSLKKHVAIWECNLQWFQKVSAIVAKNRTELHSWCYTLQFSLQLVLQWRCKTSCRWIAACNMLSLLLVWQFLGLATIGESRTGFYFFATIVWIVLQLEIATCNMSFATCNRLRDQLQEKLRPVTPAYSMQSLQVTGRHNTLKVQSFEFLFPLRSCCLLYGLKNEVLYPT